MKRIIFGLFISLNILFAKNGYVDVNVLLIKKYPSDQSVKFGYYKKYTQISVLETHDGIDNDDKWYLTNRGYVRAKYVVLNEDLPRVLAPHEVDTTKYAIQLAVYPKRAKFSLKEGIRKLQGEKSLFIEETSRAKVLYLVNFSSYKDAINKVNSINAFKGFVTKIKLNKNTKKLQKIKNNNVPKPVVRDDEIDFKAIMKKIYSESENTKEQLQDKPEIEKIEPNVIKDKFINIQSNKIETKSDYNMNRELSKTLENTLIELDRL